MLKRLESHRRRASYGSETPWVWPRLFGRDRVPELLPDLLPKYLVIVGTRWYLLGLAAALEYQRVPASPNSHKHFRDSNSLGGTIRPQARGLSSPISRVKSGYKYLAAESGREVQAQLRGCGEGGLKPRCNPCC